MTIEIEVERTVKIQKPLQIPTVRDGVTDTQCLLYEDRAMCDNIPCEDCIAMAKNWEAFQETYGNTNY